ncbi:TIGR03032 family protein [Desulfosudis oleivorans]|uniref:GCN5-related N-acetyltransferase n=1 Tax=Desulfosudis oleivorans (strain DSM 6200 / JCM 39069 / Hxd3) TaxID=96561 RepID=A9A0T4_DESOH|nr:TIGR03032 family protein [Desulfosudis oleivorans]ABW67559.1 GCN5-related N-acetyltransferase [Desulfosudis oleivorans Hxd3]
MNAAQKKPPLEIVCSRHFLPWLHEHGISLAFTTYQSCRLFFIGLKPDGTLSAFERLFDRAMGLYTSPERLYMSSRYQIWQFDNVLAQGETYKGYDRLYVPRIGFTTGDLDVHDIVVDDTNRVMFVNTLYSCLATLHDTYSFTPLWKPPFITKLAPEDRCHLNGLAVDENRRPRYVTAVSRSDMFEGWREKRSSGGLLMEIPSGEPVVTGLSMPHSPRIYQGRVWLLNSGTGELGYVDTQKGAFEPVAFCRGYTRGLAFYENYAIVGLSKPRANRTFTGLPLDERLATKETEPCCGLMVIDINTGDTVHWMMLEGVTTELYDVQVLPGIHRPMALGHKTDEIKTIITLPPDHRAANNPAVSSPAPPPAGNTPSSAVPPANEFEFKINPDATAVDIIKISGITFPNVQKRWQVKPAGLPLVLVTASLKGSPVAAAVAEIRKNGEHAEILSLYVAPEFRKQGIGARLVSLMESALAHKKCRSIEINFRTDWEGCAPVEKIIAQQGWLPPKTPRILCKSSIDRITGAPWMKHTTLPDGLGLFPWSELTDADRNYIRNRQEKENWFPPVLTPFQEEASLEHANSVGLRRNGQVAGWMITHRTTADTIQYTSLFVEPDLRSKRAVFPLIVEAVTRQIQAGVPNGIWMIDTQNTAMRKFTERHLKKYLVSMTELRHSVRLLRAEETVAPGATYTGAAYSA